MSIELTSHYGGLVLRSPLIVGACPLTAQEPMQTAIELAGAGAIVLPSLFEEQVLLWAQSQGQSLRVREQRVLKRDARMRMVSACHSAEGYLSLVSRASSRLSIPVIASLIGEDASSWLRFVSRLQEAGASGIELNLNHPSPTEFAEPREIEDQIVEAVKQISDSITIPLFLKLGREFTSLSHMAVRLLSGAQGLVLFGRSPQLDIMLDSFELTNQWLMSPTSSVVTSLESIMRVHAYCPVMPLAACGGIHCSGDLIKVLLAGADVAMIASAVYREGPDVIRSMMDGLIVFMERHRLRSILDLHAVRPLTFTSEEERLDYVQALSLRPDPQQYAAVERTMHGDRWGHRRFSVVNGL